MLRSHVMTGGESDHPQPPQEEGKLPLSLHLKLKRTHHLREQEKEARGKALRLLQTGGAVLGLGGGWHVGLSWGGRRGNAGVRHTLKAAWGPSDSLKALGFPTLRGTSSLREVTPFPP